MNTTASLTAENRGGAIRQSRVAPDESLLSKDARDPENSGRWASLIADRIVPWELANDDDEVPVPTPIAIEVARRSALDWQTEDLPAPHDIFPDGDGGFVFEIVSGPDELSIRIHSDGSRELLRFEASRLVESRPV